jgi:hypothetical protein
VRLLRDGLGPHELAARSGPGYRAAAVPVLSLGREPVRSQGLHAPRPTGPWSPRLRVYWCLCVVRLQMVYTPDARAGCGIRLCRNTGPGESPGAAECAFQMSHRVARAVSNFAPPVRTGNRVAS